MVTGELLLLLLRLLLLYSLNWDDWVGGTWGGGGRGGRKGDGTVHMFRAKLYSGEILLKKILQFHSKLKKLQLILHNFVLNQLCTV